MSCYVYRCLTRMLYHPMAYLLFVGVAHVACVDKLLRAKKGRLDVIQSYPLRRTHFEQCQTSSTVLGRPGDGDCYLMHKTQRVERI